MTSFDFRHATWTNEGNRWWKGVVTVGKETASGFFKFPRGEPPAPGNLADIAQDFEGTEFAGFRSLNRPLINYPQLTRKP